MHDHPLHSSQLPEFARTWPESFKAVIEAHLEDGFDATELRTIVIGPTQDRMQLGVWLGLEWSSHLVAGENSSPIGYVPLAPWLDLLDSVARGDVTLPPVSGWKPKGGICFAEPTKHASYEACWRQLYDALAATALELATRHLADKFENLVGVFVATDDDETAGLVAFCHERGGPLWPVAERRKEHGYGSVYPEASLAGDQLTLFYPEGEAADDDGPPAIRSWTHEAIEYARTTDEARELLVRFKGEAFDVQFKNGHTREEQGGPEVWDVMNALEAFFDRKGVLERHSEPPRAPPKNPTPFKLALEASREACGKLPPSVLDLDSAKELPLQDPAGILGAKLQELPEATESRFEVGLRRKTTWWAADGDRRLVELATPDADPKLLATWPAAIHAMVETPEGVVIAQQDKLTLVDDQGVQLATATLPSSGRCLLAVQGELLACSASDVLHLFRVASSGLQWLGCLRGSGEKPSIVGLGFVSETRLLISTMDELLLVDVSSPEQPAAVRRWEGDFRVLHARQGLAAIEHAQHVWIVEGDDDLRCTVRVRCGSELVWVESPGLAFFSEGRITVIGAAQARKLTVLGPDGNMPYPCALALTGAGASLVEWKRSLDLEPLAFDLGAIEAEIEGTIPRVREWLFERVDAAIAQGVQLTEGSAPLGGVVLRWQSPDLVTARMRPPLSAPCFEPVEPEKLRLFESAEPEEDPDASAAAQQQRAVIAFERQRATAQVLERVGRALLREVAAKFTGRTASRDLLLGHSTSRGLEIVTVVPGGGEAANIRGGDSAPPPKSLLETLTGTGWRSSVDAWISRATRDEAFRTAVMDLLVEQDVDAAYRIALKVIDAAPEVVSVALLAAADRDLDSNFLGLEELAKRRDPRARERLVALADGEHPAHALRARRALGRVDEDASVEYLRQVLATVSHSLEVPLRPLEELGDARIVLLKDDLIAAYERMGRHRPLQFALVRSGWTPDEEVRAKAVKARKFEVEGRYPDDDSQTLRLWTAYRMAESSEWPSDVPRESSRTGWQHFFDVAWPVWSAREVLPKLFDVLPARAAQSPDDAQFALDLLHQALIRGEPLVPEFARALEAVPYEDGKRDEVLRLAGLARLKFGWTLMKEGRLKEARKVADAALTDAPNDGQTLFYDARLAWLEQDDPEAAIVRTVQGLEKANEPVGRARLMNLHGAALDAQGKTREALAWFHQAFTTNESKLNLSTGLAQDATMSHSILSNIAEAHWKLGEREEARRFAEEAAHRGSSTAIVQEILAAK